MTALRRTVHVPARNGEITVIYRPAWIVAADDDHADRDPKGTAARLILSSVATWTLSYHDGERYPLNAASVAALSDKLVLDIAKAIIEDYRAVVAESYGKVWAS
jgi:hypothetical protein